MIIEQMLVTGMAVFSYLVADEKSRDGVVIDPAGDFDIIFSELERHGVNLKWVINTHSHFDHTSGNDYIINKTGAGLMIHELEAQKLNSVMNRILRKGGKSPEPVKLLKDSDIIKIGSIEMKVLHTPGHSPGSITLYAENNLFTGDTLFTEGMGRTDLPGGSQKQIMNSIRNIILSFPDDTIIWPGHHYGRNTKSTVKEQKRFYFQPEV